MKPLKPPAPSKSNKNDPSDWLSTSVICLFAAGVLAAKMVFLVDNELEIKTKFGGQNWQLNSPSVRKYATDAKKITSQYLISPLDRSLRQESSKLIVRAGNALTDRQNLCVSTSQLSTILTTAKSLNPIESDNSNPPIAGNAKVPKTADRSIPSKHNTSTVQRDPNWCITTGVKK
jgi:hypothetical protein